VIASKPTFLLMLAGALVTANVVNPLYSRADTPSSQWSVEVAKVDSGEVNLEPSFQVAIYESLLDQLNKSKQFKQVFRDGDRDASGVSDLVILKTTVEKYSAGSETKRAVTTVAGATKLTVRTQLCTGDGKVVLERTINGNVRFMGSNLRATHNLARNVVKAIGKASLPQASSAVVRQTPHEDEAVVVELR
jgi:hypothetical protein